MANLQFVGTVSGAGYAYLDRIGTLSIIDGPGGPHLHTASAQGGTTTFSLNAADMPDLLTQAAYATISRSFAQLPGDTAPVLIAQVLLQTVLANAGGASPATGIPIFARNSGFIGDQVTLLAVDLPGGTYLFSAQYGQPGISSYRVTTAATAIMPTMLAANGSLTDGTQTHLADVSALASASFGAATFLFTASSSENGIDSYRIDATGGLTFTDAVDEQQGLYTSGLSALHVAGVAGQTYLLATASGSSSLSVLRLDKAGQMTLVDHVMDSQDTRFANASALDVVTSGERTYAIVAGADDGITLFTLLPGGRLYQLGSYADTSATSLTNVSALAAAVVGSEIQVFATSGSEPGLSLFRIDLSQQGQTLIAGPGAATLTGGAFDDVIMGRLGADILYGGSGNDLLLDGAGSDQLYGGAGSDVFVLTYDNRPDRIMDYQPGADRLDLSAWPMLYSPGQILLSTTATGANLTFGNERLEIVTATQRPLTLAELATPDILNLMRQFGILSGPNLTLTGTAGGDLMIGAAGKDKFMGTRGGDWMCGGGGLDTVSYARSTGPVTLDLKYESRSTGDAAFDSFESIERFFGSLLDDSLCGGSAADWFLGGKGSDFLLGRGGNDLLEGSRGRDKLAGGFGADTLSGGPGGDIFLLVSARESPIGPGYGDLIRDFQPGIDHIMLARMDANPQLAGDQAFTFIGTHGFNGTAGKLRYAHSSDRTHTIVAGDLNGDAKADFRITLDGLHTISAGDFLL